MTEEEKRLERGRQASALLASPVFGFALNEFANDLQSAFFTTQPGETAERETAYFTNAALNGIVNTLKTWVNEKIEIEEKAKATQENFDNE